ncbi:hypothetical protein ACTFIW_000492 (mitochondrion) [Dictyostelium discoideum]
MCKKKVFITPKKELFNVMERSMKKQSVGRSALLNVKKKKYRAVVTTNVSKSVRNTVLNVVYNNNWLQYLKKQKNKINKQLRVGNISNIQERKKVQQLSRIIKASTLKLSTLMIREGSSVTTVKETVKENIKKFKKNKSGVLYRQRKNLKILMILRGRQRRLLQLRQTKENKKLNEVIKNFELKEIALNKTYTTNISTLEINWINNLQSIINHISKIQNNTALERLYELLVKNKRSVSTVIDILNEKLNIKGNKESKVSLLKLKGAWNSIAINYRWGYLLLLKGQRQLRIKQLAKEKLLKIQKNQRYKVIKRHRNKFQKNRNKFQRNTRNKFQRNRNKFQRNRNKFQRNRNKFQRNRNKFQRNRNKFQRNIRNKFQRNIRNKFQRNIRNNFGRNKFQKIIEQHSNTRTLLKKYFKSEEREQILSWLKTQTYLKACYASAIKKEAKISRIRELAVIEALLDSKGREEQPSELRELEEYVQNVTSRLPAKPVKVQVRKVRRKFRRTFRKVQKKHQKRKLRRYKIKKSSRKVLEKIRSIYSIGVKKRFKYRKKKLSIKRSTKISRKILKKHRKAKKQGLKIEKPLILVSYYYYFKKLRYDRLVLDKLNYKDRELRMSMNGKSKLSKFLLYLLMRVYLKKSIYKRTDIRAGILRKKKENKNKTIALKLKLLERDLVEDLKGITRTKQEAKRRRKIKELIKIFLYPLLITKRQIQKVRLRKKNKIYLLMAQIFLYNIKQLVVSVNYSINFFGIIGSSITAEYVVRRLKERLALTKRNGAALILKVMAKLMRSQHVVGCKVKYSGRLTGNSMAQQKVESRGLIGNSNMNVYIDFAQDNLVRKHGKCGLKLWIVQKFTKNHKRNLITKESRKTGLVLGNYGIKATETGYLKMKQMERIKGDLVKKLKDNMDIYFNFYPLFGLTNKGTARMGAGKGEVSEWYVLVKKGSIVVEFIKSRMTAGAMQKVIRYRSNFSVMDNSGARKVQCIQTLEGKKPTSLLRVGDKIVVNQ